MSVIRCASPSCTASVTLLRFIFSWADARDAGWTVDPADEGDPPTFHCPRCSK